MNKRIIITASLFGILAVIAGAFGAHGLKKLIDPQQLEIWHTAVAYNFYHVFALLFLSTLAKDENRFITASYYLFTFGIVCFSGSLYLLACRNLLHLDAVQIIGPITPLGGLLFILGWVMLTLAALKGK